MTFRILLIVFSFSLMGLLSAQVDSLPEVNNNKEAKKSRRKSRARYLHLGFGLSSYHLQDYAVSPLSYKGPLLNGTSGYDVKGEDLIWGVFVQGGVGFLASDYSSTNTMNINTQLTSYYAKKISKLTGDKVKTYLGGYIMSGGNVRVNNGFFNAGANFYDMIISYGITGKVSSGYNFRTKSFGWNNQGETEGRHIALGCQLYVPVFHTYWRPEYAVISNFPSSETSVVPDAQIVSWETLARLTSQLDLTYFLKNNNAFRLSYKWDAYSINPGYNRIAASNNAFLVSMLFRLNKKSLE